MSVTSLRQLCFTRLLRNTGRPSRPIYVLKVSIYLTSLKRNLMNISNVASWNMAFFGYVVLLAMMRNLQHSAVRDEVSVGDAEPQLWCPTDGG